MELIFRVPSNIFPNPYLFGNVGRDATSNHSKQRAASSSPTRVLQEQSSVYDNPLPSSGGESAEPSSSRAVVEVRSLAYDSLQPSCRGERASSSSPSMELDRSRLTSRYSDGREATTSRNAASTQPQQPSLRIDSVHPGPVEPDCFSSYSQAAAGTPCPLLSVSLGDGSLVVVGAPLVKAGLPLHERRNSEELGGFSLTLA